MPREPIKKLTSAETPLELSEEVEAILEVDRLFWLDPLNKGQIQFERNIIPGEELPYTFSYGKDKNGIPHTKVLVQRWGRTFISFGKPMLMIEDRPPPVTLPRAKKEAQDHGIKNTIADFRKFMAEWIRQSQEERGRSVAPKPTAEQRAIQSSADKRQAAERREVNQARRAAVIESKRHKDYSVQRDTDLLGTS